MQEFLPQRRRWLLAMASNEMHALTDWTVWVKRPFSTCIRLLVNESVRMTGLQTLWLIYVLLQSDEWFPHLLSYVLLILPTMHWLCLTAFALQYKHYDVVLLPAFFLVWSFLEPIPEISRCPYMS